jgi:bifunctional DNA-binding transcriptional regulator/antitoxin component of YhaV-PrlF toxin-antitoxin module
MTNEYEWTAKVISRHRITIPDMIAKEWDLKEGDSVQARVRRVTKPARDVII